MVLVNQTKFVRTFKLSFVSYELQSLTSRESSYHDVAQQVVES